VLDELDLSRMLELAASVVGGGDERIVVPLAAHVSFAIGNAWPPWRSWVSVRRTPPAEPDDDIEAPSS
jgi:hypothetical protein